MPVRWNQEQLMALMRPAMMRGVIKGTELVRSTAIRSIQTGSKTGRVYQRRGVTHRASAPGEAPASDTGRLVNSITTSFNADELSGTIQVGSEYGPFLEFGTQTMEPRPFMRPALMDSTRDILEGIAQEIVAALK